MNRFTRCGLWVLSPAVLLLMLNAQTLSEAKLVGKWKLNTAKSQFQGIPRPNAATLVISEATASHLKWQATTTFSDGGRSVMGFDGAVDGKPYVYKGANAALNCLSSITTAASWKQPPRTPVVRRCTKPAPFRQTVTQSRRNAA